MRLRTSDIRTHFKQELEAENFTTDRTGSSTIEMLGASFIADEPAIFGEVNEEYVNAELDWYERMSTNINEIYDGDRDPPAAWKYTANAHGEINSNYGHVIFSPKYGSQYYRAFMELLANPDSRRAIMIYNRPSMWYEYNENGKNDFMCTNAHTFYIRGSQLHVVVQMRSNDVVFGYKNDRAWALHVLQRLVQDLNRSSKSKIADRRLTVGNIYWQVQNLHVYERHFKLVK